MAETPPDPSANVTKIFAGGIGSVTAGFAAVGAVTGGLERVFRNLPDWATAVILILTAAIIAVGIVGPAVTEKIKDGWLVVGTLLLVGMTGVISFLVVNGASTVERPSVSGALTAADKSLTVKGMVEASGLKSDEHMLIKVEGETQTDPTKDTLLYVARIGPNSEGKVKAPIETIVARSDYNEIIVSGQLQSEVKKARVKQEGVQDCNETTKYWGCARLLVPPLPK